VSSPTKRDDRRPLDTNMRAAVLQLNVLWALAMREALTRFGRHNVGMLWLVLEPMLFTLGITTVWTLLHIAHGRGISIASFALTGYSSIMLWRNPSSRIAHSVTVNMALLYHRNVKPLDVVIARTLLELASVSSSFFALLLVFYFAEMVDPVADFVTLIGGWSLLCFFSFGLSLVIAAWSERSELVDRVWHTVTYLLLPFSGAATMMGWLSPRFRDVVLIFPFGHGTEMIRHGFYGESVQTYEQPFYLLTLSLALTAIGLLGVRTSARSIEPE
jgi:capsular polysaccharide transport system permease protein